MEKTKIHSEILETFRRHQVPVDKFGHFYSTGAFTVDKLPNVAGFTDTDYMVALMLEMTEKFNDKLPNVRSVLPAPDIPAEGLKRGRPRVLQSAGF